MTRSSLSGAFDDGAGPSISSALTFVLALACGVTVANLYYVQPIAGLIAGDYGMPAASAGLFVMVTQLGYAAGLLLAVPLADILENRRLIVGLLALLVLALVALAFAPSALFFMAASILVGVTSSVVQIIVPFAGHLAPDATRGHAVGNVVSGLLFGIMLSRPASSFAAHFATHRTIFALSAVAIAVLSAFLWRVLPRRQPHGMPYLEAIRSLGPLLRKTKILQRRGAYQAALFAGFSLFWTAVPLLLSGPGFGFSQAGIGLFALAGAGGALVSPYAGRAADRGQTYLVTLLSLSGAALAFLVAMAGGTRGLLAASFVIGSDPRSGRRRQSGGGAARDFRGRRQGARTAQRALSRDVLCRRQFWLVHFGLCADPRRMDRRLCRGPGLSPDRHGLFRHGETRALEHAPKKLQTFRLEGMPELPE